jgi:hypothetical protein
MTKRMKPCYTNVPEPRRSARAVRYILVERNVKRLDV